MIQVVIRPEPAAEARGYHFADEFHPKGSQQALHAGHGQPGPAEHERLAILHHGGPDDLAELQTHHLR